jgi:hypothetical protein
MKTAESPFYLAINHRRLPQNPIWFAKGPLGKNEIGKFLVNAAKNAEIHGNITNHSVRKTCISRLMEANVPTNYVAQLSGHRNLKSLDSYKTASVVHQRQMSRILSRSGEQLGQENSRIDHAITPSSNTIAKEMITTTSSAPPSASSLFSGDSIGKFESCIFNFNHANSEQPIKRRRIILSDDSDSD